MILLIFVLMALLFWSAIFSAAETALFSISSFKIKSYKHEEDFRKKLISNLMSSPRDLLVTIIMLNIAINILIQNLFSSVFGERTTWILNVGAPFIVTLIIGEVIPKSLGLLNNDRIAYRLAPLIAWLQKGLFPIRRFLVMAANFVSRFFLFFLKKEQTISIDELQYALKTSCHYGILNEEEAEIVRGYLILQESTVREKMRPREDVLFFDIHKPLHELIHLFVDQECSRIPICDGGLDRTIGVMTSQLFFLHKDNIQNTEGLLSIMEKPFFTPETISATILLKQFYIRSESFAIVIDEYSAVSGIICLEDLVETVVGEIADRRDEPLLYTLSGQDVVIASGRMELGELKRIFEVPLFSEANMVTVGGYLTEKLGDIPKTGDTYLGDGFLFHVLAAEPTRVRRLYIRRLRGSS